MKLVDLDITLSGVDWRRCFELTHRASTEQRLCMEAMSEESFISYLQHRPRQYLGREICVGLATQFWQAGARLSVQLDCDAREYAVTKGATDHTLFRSAPLTAAEWRDAQDVLGCLLMA